MLETTEAHIEDYIVFFEVELGPPKTTRAYWGKR